MDTQPLDFGKPLSIQPIPYQGSKRSLAPRIARLFPEGVETLYEPFAGSAAMTVFAAHHGLAERFVISDSFVTLMHLWERIVHDPTGLSEDYARLWRGQLDDPQHFNKVRSQYNEDPEPIALLYLVARCVKNAVRFNAKGHFTQSADKRRTGVKPDRLTRNVHAVSRLLKGKVELRTGDFATSIKDAGSRDLVYMDPPYQGTTNGRDKRYIAGLSRERLIDVLEGLRDRGVPFILSYDGRLGDKSYGPPLPASIGAHHLEIEAGRSSQATLNGRAAITFESVYVSRGLPVHGLGRASDAPLLEVVAAE